MAERRERRRRRPQQEDSDDEFSVTSYETNVHQSAVNILVQIPNVTPAKIRHWLHTARVITPVEDIYDHICRYVSNSQCHKFGIQVLDIIRIARVNQQPLGQNDPSLRKKDRMLLWHGTKDVSVAFILEHGFKPPPSKGQMFGSGIYFADRASKSARYCPPDKIRDGKPGEIGYMLLCDVLLGKVYNAKNAHQEYTTAPTITDRDGNARPCDSVKCTGRYIPDPDEREIIRGNLVIPNGETIENDRFDKYTVYYNEFIVYSEDRCKPDYLVRFEFTANVITY